MENKAQIRIKNIAIESLSICTLFNGPQRPFQTIKYFFSVLEYFVNQMMHLIEVISTGLVHKNIIGFQLPINAQLSADASF